MTELYSIYLLLEMRHSTGKVCGLSGAAAGQIGSRRSKVRSVTSGNSERGVRRWHANGCSVLRYPAALGITCGCR